MRRFFPLRPDRFDFLILLPVVMLAYVAACARLPYVTTMIQDQPRLRVVLEREVEAVAYAHPLEVSPADVAALLKGFSLRPQPSLPLRWYAEEAPPAPLFREDEISVLAPVVADALRRAGPQERVHFSLFAPGMNPRYDRDVTGGWLAVRGAFLHLTIEYFHQAQPMTRSSPYDFNYPTPPAAPDAYVLYFEPGRFWLSDESVGRRGVDFRAFLRSAEARP
jgi:hypothetical protein